MRLHELKPTPGSRHKKKILGRGEGSGHGGSATRGTKGQGSRSGSKRNIGFEGGQTPLIRRIPKRGFSHSRFKDRFSVVNVGDLDMVCGDRGEITPDYLIEKGVVRKNMPVKVLGDGKITKPVTIKAHSFSESAEKKITAAGGKIEKIY